MRLRLPRVLPVELWDLPVDGRLLQAWRDDATFPARLAAAVHALRAAPPATFTPRARRAAGRIEHVHVVGGGVTPELTAAIAAPARLTVTHANDPFAPARAGCALRPGTACADVGQTAIKLAHGGRTWRVDRDRTRAPMRDDVAPADRAAARRSTVEFLAGVLAGLDRVVLALPCELDDRDRPRGCTYCWPDPDPELIGDLARLAGCALEVVNDAELAAVAALPHVPAGVTALVLTIGFSVGGALVLPMA